MITDYPSIFTACLRHLQSYLTIFKHEIQERIAARQLTLATKGPVLSQLA
jgi:hypothetical protein